MSEYQTATASPELLAALDLENALRDRERAGVGGESLHGPVVEVRSCACVAPAARDVAGLRVCWPSRLRLPQAVVLLPDEPQLAKRLAVARLVAALVAPARHVDALAAAERVEELRQLRVVLAAHGRAAEWRERHQVGVEFADPVNQAVTTRIRDQDVEARAAVDAVFVAGVGAIGRVVKPGVAGLGARPIVRCGDASCVEVVIGVAQVVAPAAPERVLTRAADEPVVSKVAEDHVAAVGRLVQLGLRAVALVVDGDTCAGCWHIVAVLVLVVEEELVREQRPIGAAGAGVPARRVGGAAPDIAGGAEFDGAARVVLVVQEELTKTRLVVVVGVPRVGVGTKVQRVSRVPRVGEVDVFEADQGPGNGIEVLVEAGCPGQRPVPPPATPRLSSGSVPMASAPLIASSPAPPWIQSEPQPPKMMSSLLLAS